MTILTGAFIIVMSFLTAALSGVFGMAGGLLLKGALALVLPVSATFVVHGILQLVANAWRAILHRRHVDLKIVGLFAIGSFAAGAVMAYVALEPTKATLYLLMGLVPGLVWLPDGWVKVDASRPGQALLAGFIVTCVNLTAGVAGPLLDVFFVRTALTRHEIVATKAATQVFSHIMKIAVYGAPLLAIGGKGMPPAWVFGGPRARPAERREFQTLPAPDPDGDRRGLPGSGGAALPWLGLRPKKEAGCEHPAL